MQLHPFIYYHIMLHNDGSHVLPLSLQVSKLNRVKKVIFNRQPWPFLGLWTSVLSIWVFFFLIRSDQKNLARWEANDSEEKPACLQRTAFAAWRLQMCTVHEGPCTYWHQTGKHSSPGWQSQNKPNAVRWSRMTTKTSCHSCMCA